MDAPRNMEVALQIPVTSFPEEGKDDPRTPRDELSRSASTIAPSPLAPGLGSPASEALFEDAAEDKVALDQAPAPVFIDHVCSVCLCRLADNEIALDQGLGALPANGESVRVVTCTTCWATGRSFERPSPEDDQEPRYSERRSHFEAEKNRLNEEVLRQKQAAEEATAEKERREKEHQAEKEKMEQELRELREGLTAAAQHMPTEQRQSWMQWLLRRQPQ